MSKLDKIKNAKSITVYTVHSSLDVPYRSEKIFITTKSDGALPECLKTYFKASAHALHLIRGCGIEDKSNNKNLLCKLHYENGKSEKRYIEKTWYGGKNVAEYIENIEEDDKSRIIIC